MKAHVDSLNSIEKLENLGFKGRDASLSISLGEYRIAGLTYETVKYEENLWKVLIVYSLDNGYFDRATYDASTDVEREWNWIFENDRNRDSLSDYLSGTEETIEDFLKWDSLYKKIEVLFDIFGYENIFGTTYGPGFQIEGLYHIVCGNCDFLHGFINGHCPQCGTPKNH